MVLSQFLSQRPRTALSADNTRPQYAPGETPSNSLLGGYFPNNNPNSVPAPQYAPGAVNLPFSPPNPPQPPNPPPSPTTTVLPNSPTSTPTPTDNKKYMYIAGGLIITFFIFRKK